MSVVKSVRSRKFIAALTALGAVAAMLLGTRVAVADSVWVQSYQRGSASEACVAQAGETPWQDSWGPNPGWSPSWEQWANAGKGGWTCTRSITWAQTPAPAASSSGGGGDSVTYRVGDVGPGGGTVFYVDMARAAGSQFWEVGSDLGSWQWGCNSTGISGASGEAIGDGEANTTAITTFCISPPFAASVASASEGGFYDWFLPSKDELNQLCKYARTQSTDVADQTVTCDNTGTLRGGFASVEHWSSSQYLADISFFQSFGSGTLNANYKFNLLRVRAVRAF